jgi:hypothetical protein
MRLLISKKKKKGLDPEAIDELGGDLMKIKERKSAIDQADSKLREEIRTLVKTHGETSGKTKRLIGRKYSLRVTFSKPAPTLDVPAFLASLSREVRATVLSQVLDEKKLTQSIKRGLITRKHLMKFMTAPPLRKASESVTAVLASQEKNETPEAE